MTRVYFDVKCVRQILFSTYHRFSSSLHIFFLNNNKTFFFILKSFIVIPLTISNGLEVETLSRRRCNYSLILISIVMMIIDHVIFLFRWYRCQRFRFFVFFNHLLLFIVSVDSLSLCLNWNDHLALFLNRYSSTLFSFHRLFILNGNVLNSLWIDLADILSYQISSFSSSISDWFHEW